MKRIPLSNGRFVAVDDEDFQRLARHKWSVHRGGRRQSYAARWVTKDGKQRPTLMHREILGAPVELEVDHIDGDGLNNTKENLRLCNHKQNLWGRRPNKNSSSPYRGVYKDGHKYVARIQVNGRRWKIGKFANAEDAARAYDHEAKKHYGDFARLNLAE